MKWNIATMNTGAASYGLIDDNLGSDERIESLCDEPIKKRHEDLMWFVQARFTGSPTRPDKKINYSKDAWTFQICP